MWRNRFSVRVLCLSLLIILTHSLEPDDPADDRRVYDLDGVFRRIGNTFKYRNESAGYRLQQYPDVAKYLLQFPENLFQNSSKCLADLAYTGQNLMKSWALQMLDSYGKPTSGILQGNTKWIGNYDECIQVRAPPSSNSAAGNFRGKYCSLKWSLTLANFTLSATSGVCIPSSCSPPEIHNDPAPMPFFAPGGEADDSNKTIVKVLEFKCKPTERTLNSGAKAVIALLSLFGVLTVLGSSVTAIKYFKERMRWQEATLVINSTENIQIGSRSDSSKDTDHALEFTNEAPSNGIWDKCQAFLDCFCIFKNGAKILNTNTGEGEMVCIHGIRFLSMSWVILGHTYLFSFSEIDNFLALLDLLDDFAFTIVLQGFYSVDSFFVISGFLLTYLAMQEFSKKNGGISWPYFYIHRYIRLTPVYMLLLGFSATVYFYLGSGPFWPDGDYDPICKDSWWWNLLYINNFLSKQCMGWSWYLANDMQFFIISPLFLITLWRWPRIGYGLVGIFLFVCFLTNFFITFHFDLPCGAVLGINRETDLMSTMNKSMTYFDKVYIKPYTRIGPYLIGILLGYILFTRKMNNKPKHNWVFLCVGWVIASSVTLACVYGLYHAYPTLVVRSIYNAVNRTLFAAGLAWVIYVCLIGQGGFVNSILSYKLFIPLSRLTYVAYLIHPMLIPGYFVSLKTSLYFTHPTMVYLFLGMLVMSYAVALPVTLMLESPVISLEKLVRTSFTKKAEPTK